MSLNNLKIKIFADGANKESMIKLYNDDLIKGLTTNPTLMSKEGITNYSEFCIDILKVVKNKPISFEVFSDDFDEMYQQSKIISGWGQNVFVKIPIMNTKGEYSYKLIKRLSDEEIKVNVTAVFTLDQCKKLKDCLNQNVKSNISIFAGRIADTGVDPIPMFKSSLEIFKEFKKCEFIWASPREFLNVVQADEIGCHIITVTPDIISKGKKFNYDLEKFSQDTVKMFYSDAVKSGYKI